MVLLTINTSYFKSNSLRELGFFRYRTSEQKNIFKVFHQIAKQTTIYFLQKINRIKRFMNIQKTIKKWIKKLPAKTVVLALCTLLSTCSEVNPSKKPKSEVERSSFKLVFTFEHTEEHVLE